MTKQRVKGKTITEWKEGRTVANHRNALEEYRLTFTYTLYGPYIEVGFVGYEVGFDVINVWGYEEDRSTVKSRDDFVRAVNRWVKEQTPHDLRMHKENMR